jgi:hypothetical protein
MRAPILALVLASVPAIASAQEAPPIAPMMPPPAAGVAAPAAESADIARLEDPNIDRVFLLPSADTQPRGTLSLNDYELFLFGMTYGVTDDFQISATALLPVTDDMSGFASASAKFRLLSRGRVHLALQGSLTYVGDGDDDAPPEASEGVDDDEGGALGVSAGALATFCLDAACRSGLHASVTGLMPVTGDSTTEDYVAIYSAGATVKVAKHIKLLGEVTGVSFRDHDDSFLEGDGALVSYGVRFFSHSVAGDIGFVRPLTGEEDTFLLGLPFVNFTFRSETGGGR